MVRFPLSFSYFPMVIFFNLHLWPVHVRPEMQHKKTETGGEREAWERPVMTSDSQHFSNYHHHHSNTIVQAVLEKNNKNTQKLRHFKALPLRKHVCLIILFGPKRIIGTKGMFTHPIQISHFAVKCHFWSQF